MNVSIIIVHHYAVGFLVTAIEALHADLNETRLKADILVIDKLSWCLSESVQVTIWLKSQLRIVLFACDVVNSKDESGRCHES